MKSAPKIGGPRNFLLTRKGHFHVKPRIFKLSLISPTISRLSPDAVTQLKSIRSYLFSTPSGVTLLKCLKVISDITDPESNNACKLALPIWASICGGAAGLIPTILRRFLSSHNCVFAVIMFLRVEHALESNVVYDLAFRS